ncbi:hypothetical protein F5Y19DRAFT_464139 [Xylariaceae sp. FL1651]|nr:hypothetical protein F5Y19DRAFT_464139 [Xylariaceae sp. FL1651]
MEQHRKECPGPPKKHGKQCTKCRQLIDRNKFEEHFKACEYWYCRHCLMAIVASKETSIKRSARNGRGEHLPNCPLWRCTHCIRKFPRLAKDEHVQSCEFWLCKLCLTVVLKTERDTHLQKCARWCCGRCQTIMSKSERDQHLQTCEYWRCSRCSKRYLASMRDEHKIACAEALPAHCIYCRKPGLHDEISKHEAECEARAKCTTMKCPSCSRIVERNEPHDYQRQRCSICLRRFLRGCEDDHLRHCEGFKKIDSLCSKEESDRAIRSSLSQGFRFPLLEDGPLPLQVVPATVIDHGMTIGELRKKISLSKFHQARGPFCSVAVIQKFQPGRDEYRTTGMTCHAIADLIRKHVDSAKLPSFTQEHGPVKACITWAVTQIDIRCLSYILKTAGAEYLLISEWKFSDQPLGWLTLDAHDAGVDVTTTIRLVKAYLLRAFELDAEKLLGLLEKATPTIALSEVVDDNKISQSGIDKFLDDDDESLEDIPDDESAADLSIRLE